MANNLLEIGGWLFWIITCAMLTTIFVGTAKEMFFLATIGVIFAIAALMTVGNASALLQYLPSTWYSWTALVLIYAVIGFGWSTYRFWNYYRESVHQIAEKKPEWLKRKDIAALSPEEQQKKWSEYVDELAPQPWRYKEMLAVWMLYWPFDIVVYLCFDLLYDFWNWMYGWFSGVFEAIAARLRDSIK